MEKLQGATNCPTCNEPHFGCFFMDRNTGQITCPDCKPSIAGPEKVSAR